MILGYLLLLFPLMLLISCAVYIPYTLYRRRKYGRRPFIRHLGIVLLACHYYFPGIHYFISIWRNVPFPDRISCPELKTFQLAVLNPNHRTAQRHYAICTEHYDVYPTRIFPPCCVLRKAELFQDGRNLFSCHIRHRNHTIFYRPFQ